MSALKTIFVNIVAYRDSELYPTVRDLFERAKYPQRLHIAICWQYNTLREEPFTMPDRKNQVSVINIDSKKARGCSWARHKVQMLYGGEDYYLQIDSHSRIIPNWDEIMIAELERCPSPKPILSTYPNHYTLPDTPLDHGPYKLVYKTFHNQVPGFDSRPCTEEEKQLPSPSLCVSGGFSFLRGETIIDVPCDPHIYFYGEEVMMSIRYWTHGYDLFTPTRTMLFHLYTDPSIPKNFHWNDHPDWHAGVEVASHARLMHLMGITPTTDPRALKQIDMYGLGTARTLAQYEAYAGINLKEQTYSDNARNGIPSV